jgi:hypothetical protein
MHAGKNWDDVVGESGPEDPDLSLISLQTTDGQPIAVLANFSMHYFGDQAISADYFGLFSEGLKSRLTATDDRGDAPVFVGMMSHGCSGDIWRRDYTRPVPSREQNHGHGLDQRWRRLHSAAGTASAGRLQYLARSLGGIGDSGRTEDHRNRDPLAGTGAVCASI